MFTATVGNIAKCAPSEKNARKTNIEYKMELPLK